MPAAGLLPGAPDRFAGRAATILAAVGPGPQALRDAIAEARALVAETVASA